MLTNIYYYVHYIPYKIGVYGDSITEKPIIKYHGEVVIFLNTAYKKDILRYAADISSNFNGLILSANNTLLDFYNFSIGRHIDNIEICRRYIESDMLDLSGYINFSLDFYKEQTISRELKYFREEIVDFYSDNKKSFKNMGLFAKSGRLSLDSEFLERLKSEHVVALSNENMDVIMEFSRLVGKYTKKPLTAHMNFRDFSCFYNYSTTFKGRNYNPFQILDMGEMIDIDV